MISTGQVKGKFSVKDHLMISQFKSMGAATLEDYERKIKSMNLVELAEHAIKFEIAPNVERARMEKSLLGVYRKAKARYESAHNEGEVSPAEISMDKKARILERLKFVK